MAEAIMRGLISGDSRFAEKIRVESAGTMAFEGAQISISAFKALEQMGFSITHSARQLTQERAEKADLILAMQARHLDELESISAKARKNAYTLKGYGIYADTFTDGEEYDILDPYMQQLNVYVKTAFEIKQAVEKVLERMAKEVE